MNILVVGGGGREAALVDKISKSPRCPHIFCAPGNAGIAQRATLVPIAADQIERLLSFAKENRIDLTVVGPEIPLSLGIVDRFLEEGLRIFGPRAKAAQIESSKAFSKQLMQKYGIPTPQADVMSITDAYERIKTVTMPIVLKMDGLALGKGVVIAKDIKEAEIALDEFGKKDKTGTVLLERFLTGIEATFLVIADGEVGLPLSTAQDYKRIFDGNLGPNTGGMGAISPSPVMTPNRVEEIMRRVVHPTLRGMVQEGMPYQGILYVGLILTDEGPFVLEFNARLGDPEAQAVLPRLKTDWIDLMEAVIAHRIDRLKLEWSDDVAVCVVAASEGYPGDYQSGETILGLDGIDDPNLILFHAGTKRFEDRYLTHGGRVLSFTALGKDWHEARERAYRAIDKVSFRGMQYRKDIGK